MRLYGYRPKAVTGVLCCGLGYTPAMSLLRASLRQHKEVKRNGKIDLYSASFAQTAFSGSGAVVTDRATVQSRLKYSPEPSSLTVVVDMQTND